MTRAFVLAFLAVFAPAASCDPNPPTPPGPPAPTVTVPPVPPPPPTPTPTPTPPVPPAPPADAYGAACMHLASVGCSEGSDARCADRMRQADHDHLTIVPVACLTKAATKAAARACGFVKCL